MRRTLFSALFPAAVIAASWLRLEVPAPVGRVVAATALGLAPALLPRRSLRVVGVVAGAFVTAWLAFGARPWELVPPGDDPQPLVDRVALGVQDFYAVVLPFAPGRHPEMQALVLLAVYAFVSACALLLAERRLFASAAVLVAGACWPATLLDARAWAIGVVVLAAVLWSFVAQRAAGARALAVGVAVSASVVLGATWLTTSTPLARNAAFHWERWDLGGLPASALGVRFVWDASYDGISFPPTRTDVLEIRGTGRPQYWRASTLDLFTADRWVEDLDSTLVSSRRGLVPLDALAPRRARTRSGWEEQTVTVKALVDDHVVAAGTPVAIDAPRLGSVSFSSGGVVRANRSLEPGTRYRVWSYVPDPSPAALAAAPAVYPPAARRFLTVWGQSLPAFGVPGRARVVQSSLSDEARPEIAPYRPVYEAAQGAAGGAASPYAAVVAVEAWLRNGGGFRYAEQPAQPSDVPPLVGFVTRTKAGYCQHFAGAMALMLRFLGIPARVAVGFTSGTRDGDVWKVTDHDAHAWVEAWFPRFGWVPFDPTPGRGASANSNSASTARGPTRDLLPRARSERDASRTEADSGAGSARAKQVGGRGDVSFVAAVVALLGAIWTLGLLVAKSPARRRLRGRSDPRRIASATRRELEGFLLDQGVDIPPTATLSWLEEALRVKLGVDAGDYAVAAGSARFGPPARSADAARRAREELELLVRRARAELTWGERLRGAYSLRSLRTGGAR